MMSTKQKRKSLSMSLKLKIIEEIDKNRSYDSIAKEYEISKACVAGINKNRQSFREIEETNDINLKSKKLRTAIYPELEDSLLSWFKNTRSDNIPISGPLLCEKATQLACQFKITDFKASDGWLSRFKDRHNISF